MNTAQFISIGITAGGFIIGIITTVAKLASNFGKLESKVLHNEERDKEERDKSSIKFAELYNRIGINEGDVKEINTKVDSLTMTVSRIETKLDKLIERGA